MRADHAAVAALNADIRLPDRYEVGNIAFFPLRGGTGIGAVHRQGADRQLVAAPGHHHRRDLLHELGRIGRHGQRQLAGAGGLGRHLDQAQVDQGVVHRLEVLAHHFLALAGVGLLDRILDFLNRLVARQHLGNGEEAGLHDGVDARTHAIVAGHLLGIDAVDLQLSGDNLFLHRARHTIPGIFRFMRAGVEQHHRARRGPLKHIAAIEEVELMAADEVGRLHQIGRADRIGTKAQV